MLNTIDNQIQPWCPLEATAYEVFCKDLHINIRERSADTCQHMPACNDLKVVLDKYAAENRSFKTPYINI